MAKNFLQKCHHFAEEKSYFCEFKFDFILLILPLIDLKNVSRPEKQFLIVFGISYESSILIPSGRVTWRLHWDSKIELS
jgi:hypothetical protein